MTIEQLRYFVTAAECLNFSEAARRLYVAQPTLSYGISSLESQLHVKLFHRDSRNISLTASGEAFLETIGDVVDRVEIAADNARRAGQGFFHSLTIGFLGSISKKFFPVWIPAFITHHPKITLNLMQMEMGPLHSALESGEVDIAFTRSLDLRGSEWEKICDDPLCLVVRSDHPLASRQHIEICDLKDEPFILANEKISPGWYRFVKQLCRNHGFEPRIAYAPHNNATVFTLLDGGLGVSILPQSGKYYNIQSLVFLPLRGDDMQTDIVAAWRGSSRNPSISIFRDEIRNLR